MQPKNDVCFFLVVVHNVLLSLVISRQSVSCSDCSGCSHHSSQTPLFHCLLVPATLFIFKDSLFMFQESLFTFQDSLFTFQDSLPNSVQLQERSTHQWISNDPNYGWHHHQLFESLMTSPHHEYPIPPCCHLLTKKGTKFCFSGLSWAIHLSLFHPLLSSLFLWFISEFLWLHVNENPFNVQEILSMFGDSPFIHTIDVYNWQLKYIISLESSRS